MDEIRELNWLKDTGRRPKVGQEIADYFGVQYRVIARKGNRITIQKIENGHIMTKTELLETLRKLSKSTDTESAHADADDALLDYINDPDISTAYIKIDKWYA